MIGCSTTPNLKENALFFYLKNLHKIFYTTIEEIEKRRADGDRIQWLRPRARIELPTNNSINRSRTQLRKISALTEELRAFIADHFETFMS
jgi:hypothetical protein